MARILLIDDEHLIRTPIRIMLENSGHKVIEAADGEEGLQLYRQEMPDVVITDLMLPGKSGREIIRELRVDYPELKVIAMTGHAGDFLSDVMELEAEYTFIKPIFMQELSNAVTKLTQG